MRIVASDITSDTKKHEQHHIGGLVAWIDERQDERQRRPGDDRFKVIEWDAELVRDWHEGDGGGQHERRRRRSVVLPTRNPVREPTSRSTNKIVDDEPGTADASIQQTRVIARDNYVIAFLQQPRTFG